MTTYLFVGLGNPGRAYDATRHNIGFATINWLAAALGAPAWKQHARRQTMETAYRTATRLFLFAKPTTLMNNAGSSVVQLVRRTRRSPDRLWVLHDDLDLAIGTVRAAFNSRSAGHHGVQSIMDALKTQQFHRIRIGIGSGRNRGIPAETYVLQRFPAKEHAQVLDAATGFLRQFLPQQFPELTEPLAHAS